MRRGISKNPLSQLGVSLTASLALASFASGEPVAKEEVAQPIEQRRASAQAESRRLKFIKIPSGSFASGAGHFAGLSVRAFELSKSEVTVAQYRKCVSAGVCTNPDTGDDCNWGQSEREDHPINCVDWGQARTFARWAGGDLPTEAEWEYAARGGGRAVTYPWGDAQASCNYAVMDESGDGCTRRSTWPVCSKRQGDTPQGLCDMAGSMYEWVLDQHRNALPTDGNSHVGELPACSAVCDKGSSWRVTRGGSWRYGASRLRVADRRSYGPNYRGDLIGFRVRRTLP